MTMRALGAAASLVLALASRAVAAPPPVLMIADERPAMETLARQLAERAHVASEIVAPNAAPAAFDAYRVVIVYIHKELTPAIEHAALEHARAGGTLVLLHHSISSMKRANKEWFPALGITLPTGELAAGGYKYFDPTTFDVIELAANHPVTTRNVHYPRNVDRRPAFTLEGTEVYLNHMLAGPRTLLLGLRYQDAKTGQVWRQDTAGWTIKLGRGQVYYFMPGHKAADFDNATYAQILANAVASGLAGR
jgi:hypothetical protein